MTASRPPIPVRTLAVVQELPSGDVTAYPLFDAGRSVAGERDEALLELRLFLEGHLATASPGEVARHAVPAGIELRRVKVACSAELFRGSARREIPLEVACAVVPGAPTSAQPRANEKGRWVLVLPLRHTIFVADGEPIEDVVSAEVRRLLAIDLPTESAFRELCPARAIELVPLDLSIAREEGVGQRGTRGLRRRLLAQDRKRRARDVLRSIGDVLSDRPEARDGPPLVGRDRELSELLGCLRATERTSVLLVGAELAGKTALFLASLRRPARRPSEGELAASPP
ncbi:MAG: hypothetical protein IT379_16075, partial [Deltaproteobacteria bacterium]|nr:hypothetical protein [Deltaproteobacteria bacterium]